MSSRGLQRRTAFIHHFCPSARLKWREGQRDSGDRGGGSGGGVGGCDSGGDSDGDGRGYYSDRAFKIIRTFHLRLYVHNL